MIPPIPHGPAFKELLALEAAGSIDPAVHARLGARFTHLLVSERIAVDGPKGHVHELYLVTALVASTPPSSGAPVRDGALAAMRVIDEQRTKILAERTLLQGVVNALGARLEYHEKNVAGLLSRLSQLREDKRWLETFTAAVQPSVLAPTLRELESRRMIAQLAARASWCLGEDRAHVGSVFSDLEGLAWSWASPRVFEAAAREVLGEIRWGSLNDVSAACVAPTEEGAVEPAREG